MLRRNAFALGLSLIGSACSLLFDSGTSSFNPKDGGGATTADAEIEAAASDAGVVKSDGGDAATPTLCAPSDAAVGFANPRETNGGTAVFLNHTQYQVVPSIMRDGSVFRMWWVPLGTVNNPNSLVYSEAASLDGPWHSTVVGAGPNTFEVAFSGTSGEFDEYLNSASVLRVNGITYAYYSASNNNLPDAIGLATRSASDTFFTRPRGNQALLKRLPSGPVNEPNTGLLYPAAYYADGTFYLLFNDVNSPGAKKDSSGNYAASYLIRSTDPTFQSGVQSYNNGTWVAGDTRTYSIANQGATVNVHGTVAFAPELGRLLWTSLVYDTIRWVDLTLPSVWKQANLTTNKFSQRGIVRSPEGHVFLEPDCKTLQVDLMYNDDSVPVAKLSHYGVSYTIR
jgi:hypothetical protein